MGEVAAKLRVGVNRLMSQEITPPRHCVPTFPIKGRVVAYDERWNQS
jgi:hypothetical protein